MRTREASSDWPNGWLVKWVTETGSTNADLVEAARRGEPDRTVLAADHQTAGRGRLDRTWEAPPGANLLASLLLRDVPTHPHDLIQRVALSAVAVAGSLAGAEPVLKWPNDILVGGAKLAGILAQRDASPDGDFIVVGIGLNVGWAPPGAARLGDGLAPREVLAALLTAFDDLGPDVFDLYRSTLATLGQQVRIDMPDGSTLTGRALDVDREGRLEVLDDCAITHRIDTGDVVHVRTV